jgi:hypothetical protein
MRLVLILILAMSLRAADPILQQHFTEGPEGWISNGLGTLSAAESSLTFRYQVGANKPAIAVLPVATVPFGKMKSIRFEVRTDSAFAVALMLAEKKPGGGNYTSVIWSNGGDWQSVVLTPGSFTMNDGATDPVDPDGQLDLDQVQNIALLDFSQFLGALVKDSQIDVEPHEGPHFISIRNFQILPDAPAASEPWSGWFSSGAVTIATEGTATAIHYRQKEGLWSSFTHLMQPPDFAGATHLSMDVQSARDVQLIISIRDATGRHNIDFAVPAGSRPEHREVLLSVLDPAGLNIAAIRSITILDITPDSGDNDITIRDLRLSK